MKNYILFSYQALSSIYKDGAYSTIALNELLPYLDNHDKAIVTKTVYGVIEHNEEFSYMLKKLCKKSPRPSVRICLRIGMYYLKYMDSIPDYAVVNEIVELTKTVKKEQAGFVNATLKAYKKVMNDLPDGMEGLGIAYNIPLWLLDEYIKEYGLDKTAEIFSNKNKHTHVRLNLNRITELEFESVLAERKVNYQKTIYGYLIESTGVFANEIKRGLLTPMALNSQTICKVLVPDKAKSDVLDLCSAPGGKAVYIAENNPDITVYAVDIHEHRVNLIKDYAHRMGVTNIVANVWDSTILNNEWINKFDYVLLDVPCSGVGVLNGNPDIILNRTKEDLIAISRTQHNLIEVAQNYVKIGGRTVYSTCSNLKIENEQVVKAFLKKHTNFELENTEVLPDNASYYTFTNDKNGNDGFFVANLRRKE